MGPRKWLECERVFWKPRSPDLTLLDFFLWAVMNQEVYSLQVNLREHLRDRIAAAVHQIPSDDGLGVAWAASEWQSTSICKCERICNKNMVFSILLKTK